MRVPIKQYPARDLQDTREDKYWKQFRAPVAVKQVPALHSPAAGCHFLELVARYVLHAWRHARRGGAQPGGCFCFCGAGGVCDEHRVLRAAPSQVCRHQRHPGERRRRGELPALREPPIRRPGPSPLPGLQVLVYDGVTRSLARAFTRFRDKAYCGTFRDDGRLLAAGGEEGIVQVFDAESRSLLRQLRGHLRPVHVARFSPIHPQLLSGGDDATVRLWDITAGQQVSRTGGASRRRSGAVGGACDPGRASFCTGPRTGGSDQPLIAHQNHYTSRYCGWTATPTTCEPRP